MPTHQTHPPYQTYPTELIRPENDRHASWTMDAES